MLYTVSFDLSSLDHAISKLSPFAIERILHALNGDVGSLPFDVFVGDIVPAIGTGGPDEIRIDLRLTCGFEGRPSHEGHLNVRVGIRAFLSRPFHCWH